MGQIVLCSTEMTKTSTCLSYSLWETKINKAWLLPQRFTQSNQDIYIKVCSTVKSQTHARSQNTTHRRGRVMMEGNCSEAFTGELALKLLADGRTGPHVPDGEHSRQKEQHEHIHKGMRQASILRVIEVVSQF